MVVIYLPGQHGLQRGHPDAAGSEKNHNGEGHPASRRERQQDVAQRVGQFALTYINCVALTARFPVGKPVVPAALMNRPTRGERRFAYWALFRFLAH